MKTNGEITCPKCKEIAVIDGEFPKFFAWCYECKDYIDLKDYVADYFAGQIDYIYDSFKGEL